MTEKMNLIVNRIPSPTWNWLKMNETSVKEVAVSSDTAYILHLPEGMGGYVASASRLPQVKTGLGYDLDRAFEMARLTSRLITIPEGDHFDQPARVDMDLSKRDAVANQLEIHAAHDSEATVIVNLRAPRDQKGDVIVQIKYDIQKNAKLKLVTVQSAGQGMRVFFDLGGGLADSARFELIQVILGGQSCYGNYSDLAGKFSNIRTDIAYLIGRDECLDMNYVAYHTGRKTDTVMNVSGVLEGNAKKNFRGTIDFRRGAKGATGNEMEEVLLMSDDVVNQTIPVILCQEEDVEGNHGASIGKLDESLLFYMQSRGLSLDEIYRMMSRAKVEAVSARIEDQKTRENILAILDQRENR